ncbi:hypothetical protein [Carboxylicivirga caseinilyticus]|uniref:hypothetical protein n=1 Tax=Carboxylicivirga caseinilyticus TaxID=3417572 RepID=UPI003D3503D2|nr:DUF4097 family beta strand repeat protein [Marinilabiliaceae bacterium A049]
MRNMHRLGFVLSLAMILTLSVSCLQAQNLLDQVNENYSNVTSVEVEGSFCSVIITGESTNDVSFTGEIYASKNYDMKIRHNVSGGTLRVWIDRPNSISGNLKGKLEFKVPENTNIMVDNSSGSVSVEGIGQSNIRLKASSGSIKARNINSDLNISASSGSLSIEDIGGDLRAGTSSGSQRIVGVKGNVKTKASSGSIKAENIGGDLDMNTSSGGQSINMVEGNLWATATSGSLNITDVTGDVKASTSSGSMKLDRVTGAVNLSSSSGSQRGTNIKLTGASYFKASSGSVSMDFLNDVEELSFALTASSGGLNAKGSSGKKNLVIERGPIKVVGNTSSGGQSYR